LFLPYEKRIYWRTALTGEEIHKGKENYVVHNQWLIGNILLFFFIIIIDIKKYLCLLCSYFSKKIFYFLFRTPKLEPAINQDLKVCLDMR
jgi:hypothetical protein